jgi:hypothetical protein
MKLLIIIVAFFLLNTSCMQRNKIKSNSKLDIVINPPMEEIKEQYPQAEIGQILEKPEPIKINSVTIERNFMIFDVTYSGGCENHDFKLVGSKIVTKSLPPVRPIQLQHFSYGDQCKALKTEKLKFSISILAIDYERNPITLKLVNNDHEFSYIYD